MVQSKWGRVLVTATAATALGASLVACGSKPSDTAAGGDGSNASTSDFTGCMITDTGGINDKSFNASAWAGMQAAEKNGKAKVSYVESKAETDYATNIGNEVTKGCDLIVTVGGLMAEATKSAADSNPDQHFAEVDSAGNGKNWQGLQFNAAQGGFLGGYLAAGYSKTGKVATYGGLKIPPVTVYMDGFAEGVAYYNSVKSKNVQVLGWDEKAQDGSFAGGFTDQTKGQQLATNFIAQGADVIFPVAGGVGIGTAAAAQASSGKAVVIWVDTDGCESAAQYCDVFLSTVFKNVQGAVQKAVEDDSDGNFTSTDYVGTLENDGTGLSPYHDFDSKVDSGLKSEIEQVKADIISGKITITSPSQPSAS